MKSRLTREQLRERARENVKALKMASRQHAFESAREEILADLQLAEIALAAMDSEQATQPAPVVNEDLYKLANHIASSKNGLPNEWQGWAEDLEADIRRAAMLQAGNSPVIQDGYVMVPKEPTEGMKSAYYESSVAPISSLSVCGYRAMLAAAQQEVKGE